MSKHNYSQYSNKNTNKFTTTDNLQTHTNYTRLIAVDDIANLTPVTTTEPVADKIATENIEAVDNTVFGTVTNCAKLNVRVAPSTSATVVCVLDANSEIEIDLDGSTVEWYSVCTAAGIKGYCMRKFITVRT